MLRDRANSEETLQGRNITDANAVVYNDQASGNTDTNGHAADSATPTFADTDCHSAGDSAQDQAFSTWTAGNIQRESIPDTDHAPYAQEDQVSHAVPGPKITWCIPFKLDAGQIQQSGRRVRRSLFSVIGNRLS